jgi:hypothetical protein
MWENRFEVRDRTPGVSKNGAPHSEFMRPVPPTFSPNRYPVAPSGNSLGLVHDVPTRGWRPESCPLAPVAVFSRRHPRGLPLQGLHPKANAGKVLVIQDPTALPTIFSTQTQGSSAISIISRPSNVGAKESFAMHL